MNIGTSQTPNDPHRNLRLADARTAQLSNNGAVVLATNAMGTRFELVLCESTQQAPGSRDSQVFLQALGEQVIEEIAFWDRSLSRFTSGSVPARLMQAVAESNADPAHFVRLDTRVFSLLRICESMRITTQGAFDVSYASNHARFERAGLTLDEADHSARLSYSGQSLDFGAVGKGFALDCVAEILLDHGITNALVHGGTSSVLALGEWNVGVKIDDNRECIVAMRDSHLSVSSTKYKTHIVDARGNSSPPATSAVHTAAVLSRLKEHSAPSHIAVPGAGTLAEVWSTSLALLGSRIHAVPPQLTTLLARSSGELQLQGPDVHRFRIP